jgi:multimeric flavodoxin WrbA
MRIEIYYYTRSGNTRIAAKLLEEKLKERNIDVKLVEIESMKKPGVLTAGYAAARQKELPLKNTGFDLKECDALLVGCPVWGGKPSPVVKTFFEKATNGKGKKVGLFVSSGSPPGSQTIAADLMKTYALSKGFSPVDAFLSLQMMNGEIKDGTQLVPHFLEKLLTP